MLLSRCRNIWRAALPDIPCRSKRTWVCSTHPRYMQPICMMAVRCAGLVYDARPPSLTGDFRSPSRDTFSRCFKHRIELDLHLRPIGECTLTWGVTGNWMTVGAASACSLLPAAHRDASDRRQTAPGVLSDCNDFPRGYCVMVEWNCIVQK
jgi:hypothetical protein